MSNVKDVEIKGWIPFDITHKSDKIESFFADLASPSFGLHVSYHEPKYMTNHYGGQTAFFPFVISGQEAISEICLVSFINELKKFETKITSAFYLEPGMVGTIDLTT